MVVTEKRVRGEDALRVGLRTASWKYLYDGTTDDRLLYDLDADPGETRNVLDEEPAAADRFRDRLSERFDRIRETSENVDVPAFETDAEVDERLRALGYRD
jgi:arylsulfatase A-like enzyme